jgi:hypothetical protein
VTWLRLSSQIGFAELESSQSLLCIGRSLTCVFFIKFVPNAVTPNNGKIELRSFLSGRQLKRKALLCHASQRIERIERIERS